MRVSRDPLANQRSVCGQRSTAKVFLQTTNENKVQNAQGKYKILLLLRKGLSN